MKKIILYAIWAALYIACLALGFITDPSASQAVAMTIMSVIFFVPGAVLLTQGLMEKDKKQLLTLRWISAVSLGLTLVMLVANIVSVNASQAAGAALFYILNFVSVPMVCSQHYALSLFLWACILVCTLPKRKSIR